MATISPSEKKCNILNSCVDCSDCDAVKLIRTINRCMFKVKFLRVTVQTYYVETLRDSYAPPLYAVLTLKAPIATTVVCLSRLLKYLRSLYGKQCGPRSGAVCSGSTLFASILNLSVIVVNYLQQTTSADDIFQMHFFLGASRVKSSNSEADFYSTFYLFFFCCCCYFGGVALCYYKRSEVECANCF